LLLNNINFCRKEKRQKNFQLPVLAHRSHSFQGGSQKRPGKKNIYKKLKSSGDSRRTLAGERTLAVGTRAKQGVQGRPAKHKLYTSVADPDPHVFGPPGSGSGSTSQRYRSGSGSFYHHAKIVRKTLILTIL
jgi:hypothetical protein